MHREHNNRCWAGIGHDVAIRSALLNGSGPNLNLQLNSVDTHMECEVAAQHSIDIRSNADKMNTKVCFIVDL